MNFFESIFAQPTVVFYIVAMVGLLSTIAIHESTQVNLKSSQRLSILLSKTFNTIYRWYTHQAWALVLTLLVVAGGVYMLVDVHPRTLLTGFISPTLCISFLIGALIIVWVGQVALRTAQLSSVATLQSLQTSGLAGGFRTAWLRGSLPLLFGIFFMLVVLTAVVWPQYLPFHWMHERSLADHLLALALGATTVTFIRTLISGIASNALLETLASVPEHTTKEGTFVLKAVRSAMFGSLWSAKWVQTLLLATIALLMTAINQGDLTALQMVLWSFVVGAIVTLVVCAVMRKHKRYSLHKSLKYGLILSGLLLIVCMFWLSRTMVPVHMFWPFVLSFSTGVLCLYLLLGVAEYYMQSNFQPLHSFINELLSGATSSNTMSMMTISASAWCVVFLLCTALILSLIGGLAVLPWALLGAATFSMFVGLWCVLPYGGYIASLAAPIGAMPVVVKERANALAQEADSAHSMSLIALGAIHTVTHLVLVWNWLQFYGSLHSLEGVFVGVLCGVILYGALVVYLLQCSQQSAKAVRIDDLRIDEDLDVRLPSLRILRAIKLIPLWMLLIIIFSVLLVGLLFGASAILGLMLCIILLSGSVFILQSLKSGIARQAFWSLRKRRQDAATKTAMSAAASLKHSTHNALEVTGLPMLSVVSMLVLFVWIISWLIPFQGYAI